MKSPLVFLVMFLYDFGIMDWKAFWNQSILGYLSIKLWYFCNDKCWIRRNFVACLQCSMLFTSMVCRVGCYLVNVPCQTWNTRTRYPISFRLIFCLQNLPFHMSELLLRNSFLVHHWSIILKFTLSWCLKFVIFTNILVWMHNTSI